MLNPKQIVMNILSKNKNPMLNNLMNMDQASIENFARNYCKERGRDFDKEFNEFMQRNR